MRSSVCLQTSASSRPTNACNSRTGRGSGVPLGRLFFRHVLRHHIDIDALGLAPQQLAIGIVMNDGGMSRLPGCSSVKQRTQHTRTGEDAGNITELIACDQPRDDFYFLPIPCSPVEGHGYSVEKCCCANCTQPRDRRGGVLAGPKKGSVENLVGWVKNSFFKQRRFLGPRRSRAAIACVAHRGEYDPALAGDRRAAGDADRRGARPVAPAERRPK